MSTPPPLRPDSSETPALAYQSSLTQTEGVVRFDGVSVIAMKGAVLPPRCIKCNSERELKSFTRKFVWSPPWMYLLLIFPGILIGGIILVVTQRKGRVTVSTCRDCRGRRNKRVLIAWALFAASVLAFFASIIIGNGYVALFGLALLLACVIYAIVACPLITARKIQGNIVHIRGAGKEFIRSLDVQ